MPIFGSWNGKQSLFVSTLSYHDVCFKNCADLSSLFGPSAVVAPSQGVRTPVPVSLVLPVSWNTLSKLERPFLSREVSNYCSRTLTGRTEIWLRFASLKPGFASSQNTCRGSAVQSPVVFKWLTGHPLAFTLMIKRAVLRSDHWWQSDVW